MTSRSSSYDRWKRIVDAVAAAVALLVLSPLLIVVAIVVAITFGRPVFFRQPRPGLHGTPFKLVKFRTMLAYDPARGRISDGDRLTGVGRFLRATSLDELPTLYNVLLGQMSLVGPRPLLMGYLPMYTPRQARRHEVRPGVTGLAQVRGRNSLTWDAKFEYDVYYVDNRSARLDLRILIETLGTVLGRRGICARGHATAPAFTGTPVPAMEMSSGSVMTDRASA